MSSIIENKLKEINEVEALEDLTCELIDQFFVANTFIVAYLKRDLNKSYHLINLLERMVELTSEEDEGELVDWNNVQEYLLE